MADSVNRPVVSVVDTGDQSQGVSGERLGRITLRVAAALGFLGCALFAAASWLPWFVVTLRPANDPLAATYAPLLLDPGQLGAPPLDQFLGVGGGVFFWSLISVLGLLLYPLLWRRGGGRFGWWALAAYILWLLVASALAFYLIVASARFAGGGRAITLIGFNGQTSYLAVSSHLRQGCFLAWGGLILAWMVPFLPLAVAGRHGWRAWRAYLADERATVEGLHLAGRGLLVAGVALWLFSTLEMPWVTLNCSSAPLLVGSCAGLSFSGVATVGLTQHPNPFDPLLALHAMNLLLGVGALLILLGVWRLGISRVFCGWATLWLLSAAGCYAVAYEGVRLVRTEAARHGLPAGPWSGSAGILGGLLALAFGVLGLALFWARVLRPRPA